MRQSILFMLSLLLFPAAAFSQTAPTDSQTWQALLAEVRQLRHDLRTATVAAQRAQILIYRVQSQEAVVGRIQQRIDDHHSKLAQIQAEQKSWLANTKRFEELRGGTDNPIERKEIEDALAHLKASLEASASNEQEIQIKLTEAEDQLRIEQAKLGRLQDDLDRLDKALEKSGGIPGSKTD